MNSASVECVVLDAGARYGLHPTWSEMRRIASFLLFEIDPTEAERLARKYAGEENIAVHRVALFSEDTTLKFNLAEHRGLNSVYNADTDLLNRSDYKITGFNVVSQLAVPARTIDSIFANRAIHFLKLDIEGSELEALRGAVRTLRESVLGVRSEVCFAPIYKGAPLFGDIHQFLLEHGFELLNLDYVGQGNKGGRFARPDRYGKLLGTDAVWVVGNDRLFAGTGRALVENVLRLCLFLMLNNAADLAVETLLRAVTKEGVSFEMVRETPVFAMLHRKALLHFKDLTTLPMFSHPELFEAYKCIFGHDFPSLNRFYESDLFA